MITIKIDISNASCNTKNRYLRNIETIRILKNLIQILEDNLDNEWKNIPLLDVNGKPIGSFKESNNN